MERSFDDDLLEQLVSAFKLRSGLIGTSEDDTLQGGDGNDELRGRGGDDDLRGGRGDDVLRGDDGDDELRGGEDDDILRGDDGNDILRGGRGDDVLRGDDGNDDLRGGRGDDILRGDNGDDVLSGSEGDDELRGGNGDDELRGDDGDDVLRGGSGNDTFLFGVSALDDVDMIVDFRSGSDTILLEDGLENTAINIDGDNLVLTIADGDAIVETGEIVLQDYLKFNDISDFGDDDVQISAVEAFRVLPYLQQPTEDGMLVTWFTENDAPGELVISGGELDEPLVFVSAPEFQSLLEYREPALADAEANGYSILSNSNYKHSVLVTGLDAGTTYDYAVTQNDAEFSATLSTSPDDDWQQIRFVALADSETEPRGQVQVRDWTVGVQDEDSLGRPDTLPTDSSGRDLYLLNQFEGYAQNVRIIDERNPDLVVMPGDLVQGGGYQFGWDEFFRHNAGEFDDLLTGTPILPALGNWENFSAINGGYSITEDFNSVAFARSKYKVYFDAPSNGTESHQDNYYRVDYGPLTFITLDSSNGEPDVAPGDRGNPDTPDTDTNVNFDADVFRANNGNTFTDGTDLSDFNEGSIQAEWLREQLVDARDQGQIIFVQYHHASYSSGTHGIPNSGLEGVDVTPTGQAGTPLRQFTPLFDEFGVTAVLSGHSEIAERSYVNPDNDGLGVNYYDVGIGGDGMRGFQSGTDLALQNPFSQWTAQGDSGELWQEVTDADGNTYVALVDGGKHYGHLETNLYKVGDVPVMTLQMVYSFPIIDVNGELVGDTDRRLYDDVQMITFNEDGTPATQEAVTLVQGDDGQNTLVGTDGADFIIGRDGRDVLTGGNGMDVFIFEALGDVDRIRDFTVDEDVIDLSGVLGGLGINTDDALADGYVTLQSQGDATWVQIDADGDGAGRATTLVTVDDVSVVELNDAANFLF